MYNWRHMTQAQREEAVRLRRQLGQPLHSPPHGLEKHWYHVSAACYEHRPILGATIERLAHFESQLLVALAPVSEGVAAWCVLPEHYHVLLQCLNAAAVRRTLGTLHGRTSRNWNAEDGSRGRKCWFRCLLKPIESESHKRAVLNYVHNNPVHHGHVNRWQDWPFSSATQYLDVVGHVAAERAWREYPVLEMGRGWDEPELRAEDAG